MTKLSNKASKLFLGILFLGMTQLNSCKGTAEIAATKNPEVIPNDIVFGLNAYSFADLLQAKDFRDSEQVYNLFNLLDWCDYQGIKAFDPTGYFFPTYPKVPSDEYLTKFKNRADELGIAISGTGIRNNFASPDPLVRAEGVALAKEWIVVASKLGAPVLRCFAGDIPKGYENNWEEPAGWMIECYKELLPIAEQYNVKIGIQNHGDMLQTAKQCLYILEGVNSKMAGIIVDTGNFTTADPYKDIEMLVPHAVNWQVKEFTDGYGGSLRTDYKKLVKIIKDGGYKGYVPVETLKVKGDFYDPFYRVENMLTQLNAELKAAYTTK
jgi:sugar phosphate isomerase/epimerase